MWLASSRSCPFITLSLKPSLSVITNEFLVETLSEIGKLKEAYKNIRPLLKSSYKPVETELILIEIELKTGYKDDACALVDLVKIMFWNF